MLVDHPVALSKFFILFYFVYYSNKVEEDLENEIHGILEKLR